MPVMTAAPMTVSDEQRTALAESVMGAGSGTWNEPNGYRELGIPAMNELAMSLNANGAVAGALSDDPSTVKPYIWESKKLRMLEDAGFGGGVSALSDSALAVGWITLSHSSAGKGQLDYRPAIWSPSGELEVLENLSAEWGTAIDVNGSGHCLMWLHRGMDSVIALWSAECGLVQVTDDRELGVIPVGLDDMGSITAFTYIDSGSIALVGNGREQFRRLGTPKGWVPTAVNAAGWIAGTMARPGDGQPWVRSPDGELTVLGRIADHHCRPFAIDSKGRVVGVAAADHGTHAVVWHPSTQGVDGSGS